MAALRLGSGAVGQGHLGPATPRVPQTVGRSWAAGAVTVGGLAGGAAER